MSVMFGALWWWLLVTGFADSSSAGPGPCRFIGPDTGRCVCTGFVRGGYDGNCRTCSHPRWVHAGD